MFGIDDEQPVVKPPPQGAAPLQPEAKLVNPISGSETLGPPQASSGLPVILTNTGTSPAPAITQGRSMLPPPGAPTPSPPPPPAPSLAVPMPPPTAQSTPYAPPGELLDIKQKALEDLLQSVKQLEQPPADKFNMLMALIRSSDNPQLLNEAFAVAQKITDSKAKAQALLDLVNEINYFINPDKKVG